MPKESNGWTRHKKAGGGGSRYLKSVPSVHFSHDRLLLNTGATELIEGKGWKFAVLFYNFDKAAIRIWFLADRPTNPDLARDAYKITPLKSVNMSKIGAKSFLNHTEIRVHLKRLGRSSFVLTTSNEANGEYDVHLQ